MMVCNFSVATSERRKGKNGEWEKATEWHNVVSFGKSAETHGRFLDKGSLVCVVGRLQTSKYDKDGQTHYATKIIADSVEFLGGTKSSETQGVESNDIHVPQDSMEDVPF